MRETAALIGEVEDSDWELIRHIASMIGPAAGESFKPVVMSERETAATRRAEELLVSYGAPVIGRLSPLVADPRWFVQQAAARILGRIGAPEAVPVLQPLLRKSDPRVARAAVRSLASIADPAAARAIQTVMRAATGDLRRAIVDALVADKDPRVVPMLAQIVEESDALGTDHEVTLAALEALGEVGHDDAVPPLVAMSRRTGWFKRQKRRALKARAVASLRRLRSPKAAAALTDAARTGDRMLKKILNAPEAG